MRSGDDIPADAYDEEQLADQWAVSVKTLQQWRYLGLGPKYLKLGNRVIYRREDIADYERRALHGSSGCRAHAGRAMP